MIDYLLVILILPALKGIRNEVELGKKFETMTGEGKIEVSGDPAYVRTCCEASLRRLDIDCIDFYYQRRIDTGLPVEITVIHSSKHHLYQLLVAVVIAATEC
ncbi:hypothetical protein ACLOJK_006035 [Asimina triloba]